MNRTPIKMYLSSKMSIAAAVSALIATVVTFGTTKVTPAQSVEDFPTPPSMKTEGVPVIKKTDVDHLFFDPSETRSNLIWDVDRKIRSLW